MTDTTYGAKVYHKAGGNELVIASGGRITVEAGGILDLSAAATLGKGFIPINLMQARAIGSNDIPNTAATPPGGLLTLNTNPLLKRINAATDKGVRIQWAAGNAVELALATFAYPPDLDDTAALVLKLMAKMSGAADTPVITAGFFEGVGDTDAGGATAALSSVMQTLSVTIAAADVGAYPNFASITLTPGTHATDTVDLFAAWLEYTKKTT